MADDADRGGGKGFFRRPSFLQTRILLIVAATTIAVNLIVDGILGYSLVASKNIQEREVRATTEGVALLFEHSLTEAAGKIDLALQGVSDGIEEQLRQNGRVDPEEVAKLLALWQGRIPGLARLRVTDATGVVRFGRDGAAADMAASSADRDFFIAHRERRGLGMQVSKPIFGRISNTWVVMLSRRYERSDQGFAGVVVASIPVSFFSDLLSGPNLGRHGVAVLRDSDSAVVARNPPAPNPSQDVGTRNFSKELAAVLASGENAATYHSENAGEGVDRTISSRRIPALRLQVLVGMGSEDYLSAWRADVWKSAAIAIAVFLLGLISSRAIVKTSKRAADSESRSRFLLRHSSDGIHILDEHGRLLEASDSFCAMHGYAQGEMEGMEVGDWNVEIPPDTLAADMSEQVRTRGSLRIETKHRAKDGRVLDVEITGEVLELEGKTVLHCSARDITERRRSEADLRWLAQAVRQASVAIVVTDPDMRIQYANPAYETLFGYSQEELLGRGLSMFLPEDLALRAANPVESGSFEGEKIRRAKDGREISVLVKGAPIPGPDGAPVGFVFAKTDLTDLKRAQNAAEAANRAKSEFLADMSHEIRTPMNGILGMARLALMGDLPPKIRGYVEDIDGSAKRLLKIVNDILDLSKIEAAQLRIERIPLDVRSVVEAALAAVRPAAAEKGLELSLKVDPLLPERIFGDPLRIGQALLNYLGNAVKFTESGGVSVSVEAAGGLSDRKVVFGVEDTGIGLAEGQIETLFEPFRQAEDSTSRRFGGTGLGLSIVKHLAALMGGAAGAESSLGRGSRFWFSVRLDAAGGGGGGEESGPAFGDRLVLAGTRVLLAEDDPTNQRVAVGLLEAVGMKVDVAGDGEAAVEAALGNDYEIVLMDMRMPKMDGVEATRLIRKGKDFETLPIVAMTSDAMRGKEEECLAAGMNGFIGKPFDPDHLYSTIAKWVTGAFDAEWLSPSAAEALRGQDLHIPGEAEGIDVRGGLRRVAGMKALYLNTLQGFIDGQKDVCARLRDAAADGDADLCSREAHTTRGAAAMIGAEGVRRISGEIEALAAEGKLGFVGAPIDRLKAEMESVVASARILVDSARRG